jgi:hypothetical protein
MRGQNSTQIDFKMHQDASYVVIRFVVPITQALFLLLLSALIFLRVRSIKAANRQFPSRWRIASASLIVLSGALATVSLLCMITKNSLAGRTWDIANSKNLPEASLKIEDFSPSEINL